METFPAINRPAAVWLERHFSVFAAAGANSGVHLAPGSHILAVVIPPVPVLARRAASGTAPRVVVKTFFRKKLLFRNRKQKFFPAVAACEVTVPIHF